MSEVTEFKLPEIGEGVVEGEIVRWLKQPGEAVDPNEALIEVMTDKATIEVPSPFSTRITITEHKAAEGDICAVGAVIALIDGSSDAAVAAKPAAAPAPAHTPAPAPAAALPPTPAAAPAPTSSNTVGNGVLATPAARHLAREHDIDLRNVPVDARGRITKSDVLAARDAPAPPPTTPATAAPVAGTPAPKRAPARAPAAMAEDEYIPFRGVRRVIAESMVRSYTRAVHYTYVEQIDMTKLVKIRKESKALAKEQGISLSYLPFFVKAVIFGLKKYPIVNATLDEENKRIVLRKRYHIGVAAATDAGLTVPVIRDADQLSILDIAAEIMRLAEAARTGKASRDELSGSTFSISSLGNIGGVLATPIINYPEVGIMGVHAIRKVPVFDENDNVTAAHMMNLSVSLDHRVVDGFEGANFLQEVRKYLENPNLLLLS